MSEKLTADQVRAKVAAAHPEALQSPLAKLFGAAAAADEMARVIDFARIRPTAAQNVKPCGDGCKGCAYCLRESDAPPERSAVREEAMRHAEQCLAARAGWTVETLGHNIESTFSDELDADECDEIAAAALAKAAAA